MILAGDIGGTKTNLALYEWTSGRVEPIREDSFHSADYTTLEDIVEEFLSTPLASSTSEGEQEQESDGATPDTETSAVENVPEPIRVTAACFGVAGPAVGGELLEYLPGGQEVAVVTGGQGPVDEEQIDVVGPQCGKGAVEGAAGVVGPVEGFAEPGQVALGHAGAEVADATGHAAVGLTVQEQPWRLRRARGVPQAGRGQRQVVCHQMRRHLRK